MRFQTITNGSLDEHCYLIGADNATECAVIDPGMPKPVLEALERDGLNCAAILLTHGHFDHIGGVRQIRDRYGSKVYIHEADADMLQSNRLSLAVLTGDLVKPAAADFLLKGGETLQIAGLSIDVIHTPGHTKGGVSYVLKEQRKLFVGDTLFFEGAGRTDFPGGSEKELYHSIADRLFSLDGDYDVYCGHEETTTLDYERKHNPFVEICRKSGW